MDAELQSALADAMRGESMLIVKGHEVIVYPSVEVVGVSEYE